MTATRARPVRVSPSKPGADWSKWPASAGTFESELAGLTAEARAAGSSQQPTLQGARFSPSVQPTRCRRCICDNSCRARPCSACTRSSVTTILTDGDHCAGSQTLSSRWSSMNVKITYCQLNHLVNGQLGFGGRVRDRRRRPGSGWLHTCTIQFAKCNLPPCNLADCVQTADCNGFSKNRFLLLS